MVIWRENIGEEYVNTSHKQYTTVWYFRQIADDYFRVCTLQKLKSLCCREPAKFSILGALSAQLSMSAWLWDLCCFLIVIVSFSRLRGFSKEGGGHPRWSRVGVAARRGNPGQEGRNQGRRANERVSGETLVSLSSPSLSLSSVLCCYSYVRLSLTLFICLVLPSVFVFLCLSPPLSLYVFWRWHSLPRLWQLPPGTVCACLWFVCDALQSFSVFYRDSSHVFYRPTSWTIILGSFEGRRSNSLFFVIVYDRMLQSVTSEQKLHLAGVTSSRQWLLKPDGLLIHQLSEWPSQWPSEWPFDR